MDEVRRRYGIVKALSKKDKPLYMYYIMRKGSNPVGPECAICALYGHVGVIQPPETTTASGNQYQLCNSGTHQFYWNSPPATVLLPGRPPAEVAPSDPRVPGCSNPTLCKKRQSTQCTSRWCLGCCLFHARTEYEHGKNPLEMCPTHSKAIQDLVAQLVRTTQQEEQVNEDAGDGYADPGDEIQQEIDAEPPIVALQPAQLAPPLRPLRRPPQQVNILVPPNWPVPAPPGRRGQLAVPVAPLPLALAVADRNVYQGGEPRFQRQVVIQNLARVNCEETAASLERRLKVTSWRSAGAGRTDVVINTRTSRSAFTLSDHPTIVNYMTSDDGSPLAVQIYDWDAREWLFPAPDVPHPLGTHDRILIREPSLSDEECRGLAGFLAPSEAESTKKRKRMAESKVSKSKAVVKPEKSISRAVSSPPSVPPSSPSPPPLILPPPPKKCRLNANARSWIMRETYQTVSTGLENVWKLKERGYSVLDAIHNGFKSKASKSKKLTRSTWQRHDKLYFLFRSYRGRSLLKEEEGYDVEEATLGDDEEDDEDEGSEEDADAEVEEDDNDDDKMEQDKEDDMGGKGGSSGVRIKLEDTMEVDRSPIGGVSTISDATPATLDIKPTILPSGSAPPNSHPKVPTPKEPLVAPGTVIDICSSSDSSPPTPHPPKPHPGSAGKEVIDISD